MLTTVLGKVITSSNIFFMWDLVLIVKRIVSDIGRIPPIKVAEQPAEEPAGTAHSLRLTLMDSPQ